MKALKISYDQLNPEALHGVIEEFVTRDGTDYGETEVSLEAKISRVLGQPSPYTLCFNNYTRIINE